MAHPPASQDAPPPLTDDDGRDALDLSDQENADLCAGCVKCCTYITIEIDAPRAAWEYDQWIWALHHKNIALYLEKPERWFIHVDTVCEQLDERGRCSIYGRHPALCRHYDPRSCERRLPLADIVAWFQNAAEFEAWIQTRRPVHWKRLMQYRNDRPPDPLTPPLLEIAGLGSKAAKPSRARDREPAAHANGAKRPKQSGAANGPHAHANGARVPQAREGGVRARQGSGSERRRILQRRDP